MLRNAQRMEGLRRLQPALQLLVHHVPRHATFLKVRNAQAPLQLCHDVGGGRPLELREHAHVDAPRSCPCSLPARLRCHDVGLPGGRGNDDDVVALRAGVRAGAAAGRHVRGRLHRWQRRRRRLRAAAAQQRVADLLDPPDAAPDVAVPLEDAVLEGREVESADRGAGSQPADAVEQLLEGEVRGLALLVRLKEKLHIHVELLLLHI
mmetsp:Transcript_110899/g.313708  ORF Transcript_110899/g.313708 Transcript_110899/m.313708 type:complete len:207 (+) Transcript_110899:117-737(+)